MTDRAAQFAECRAHLFAVAYRMLGSRAEAEDVLQEAYLRFADAPDDARNARAWLTTVVTRLCLDQLKSARVRREQYVGPWLPEPLRTEPAPEAMPDARLGLAESVSMALLLVLESLTPAERAVLLLREVFDQEHEEIAQTLDITPDASRQLLHRARAHVEQRRPRYRATREAQQRVAEAFFGAIASGDPRALETLLAADVRAHSDGGGRVPAARKTVHGSDAVARLLTGLVRKLRAQGVALIPEPAWLNGAPAMLLREPDGSVFSVMIVQSDGERVHDVHMVNNPEKLARIDAPS